MSFLDRLGAAAKAATIELLAGQGTVNGIQNAIFDNWVTLSALSGGTDAELREPFRNLVWVYACLRKIMSTVAQVPLKFYSGKDEVPASHQINVLFDKPNPHTNRTQFIEGLIAFYVLNGEALVCFNSANWRGLPGSMWFADPLTTTYELNESRNAIDHWNVSTGSILESVKPELIMHLKQFNPYNPIRGLSNISALRITLEGMLKAVKYNRDFFNNGVAPGMVVNFKQQPSEPDVERFRKMLADTHSVDGKGHKPLVTWGETTITPGISQEDMQFLLLLKNAVAEIHAAMGVGRALTGAQDSGPLGGTDIEVQARLLWQNTNLPIIRAIEGQINRDLLQRYRVPLTAKFDISQVPELQENKTTKIADAGKLWAMGTPLAECNRLLSLDLNLAEVQSAAVSFLPIGMIPYSDEPPADPDPEPADPADPEEPAAPGPGKAATARKALPGGADREAIWKRYVAAWQPIETAYAKKLSNFLFDLRKETLANLSVMGKSWRLRKDAVDDFSDQVIFDVSRAKTRVVTISRPFIRGGAAAGARQIHDILGDAALEFNWETDQHLMGLLARRELKITGLVDTVNRQLRSRVKEVVDQTIAEAAVNGSVMSVAQAVFEAQDEIGAASRQVFNAAGSRAVTIARTEVGAAVSAARMEGFRVCGVESVEWITARDENVRQSHLDNDGIVLHVGSAFPNGLTTPNEDGAPAEEVINCRCTLVPADRGE